MKPSTFSSILALSIFSYVSCEKRAVEKPPEKQALEKPEFNKDKESMSHVENTPSSPTKKKEIHPGDIVTPAKLQRTFKEADEAFAHKDYSTAVSKIQELLKLLDPDVEGAPYEMLYFNIGLGQLLGEKYPEAVIAFKDCIQRFPEGEYKSRAYLGLGRALMLQKQPDLKLEALAAFNKAAADPRYKAEADQRIGQMSESPDKP